MSENVEEFDSDEETSKNAAQNDSKQDGGETKNAENMILENGSWVFVDPANGKRLKYDTNTKSWQPESFSDDVSSSKASENPPNYNNDDECKKNMQVINGVWIYRDSTNGLVYSYNNESSSWIQDETKNDITSEAKTPDLVVDQAIDGDDDDEQEPDPDKMDEFEYQLKLEELEKKRLAKQKLSATSSKTYVDPKDGSVYEWDHEKHAWFPKVDDDFIAKYQANYGSHPLDLSQINTDKPSGSGDNNGQPRLDPKAQKELLKQQKKEKRKLAAEKQKHAGWFDMDEDHNTNVYVSGLPLKMTDAEFEELMGKCGIVARELENKKLKLKLYKDSDGNNKGDGRCCYIKKESVDLALDILDGSFVGNDRIHVERAHFELKGDFDPAKKKRKLTAKQKKKLKEKQERLFDWHPEKLRGERPKSDATVVMKNVFTEKELFETPTLLLELQNEMKAECSKYGEVKKVVVYDNNKEGVVTVAFATAEDADDCITMMNFRVFRGHQIRAETWDGKTKYKSTEAAEEEQKRLSNWHQFLESSDNSAAAGVDQQQPQLSSTTPNDPQDQQSSTPST